MQVKDILKLLPAEAHIGANVVIDNTRIKLCNISIEKEVRTKLSYLLGDEVSKKTDIIMSCGDYDDKRNQTRFTARAVILTEYELADFARNICRLVESQQSTE